MALIKKKSFLTAALTLGTLAYGLWRQSQKLELQGKTVFITGGSRGLGLELARRFAEKGARLFLVARNKEELQRARQTLTANGASVEVQVCDISNQQQVEEAVQAALDRWGSIDVLVNNAGIIQVGPFEHMQKSDFETAMGVHLWGPLMLIQQVLPHMKRQQQGHIVNISSIGGKVPIPHLIPYCTSKFALTGLSEGIQAELARTNITVTTVIPGLMRTGSHVNALFKGQHRQEFGWFSIGNAMPFLSTGSQNAARQIVKACEYGSSLLIITPQAKLLDKMHTLFPDFTAQVNQLANRLLPSPTDPAGDEQHSGWESRSSISPSPLTWLSDRAIAPNNEQP